MSTKDAYMNKPDYSTFDLSHLHRTSLDMGNLVPIACIPTLPGDRFNVSVDAFVRGMPTIAPIVDKVDIKINHFYVPNRVIWEAFQDFITHDDTYAALGTPKPSIPKVGGFGTSKLADYLGIPGGTAGPGAVNALPFMAYQRIYLEYYAPQRWIQYLKTNGSAHDLAYLNNYMEQLRRSVDGVISSPYIKESILKLRKVGWNHDYFTNALPTPTLFNDVKMPLFTDNNDQNGNYWETLYDTQTGTDIVPFGGVQQGAGENNLQKIATLRELRKSIALQHYLEKLQTGGGRYLETIKVLWNQDLRNQQLQRPEYLGGDVIPLFVNEVESTASTEKADLGDVGGKPVGAGRFENINFTADEHGFYMVLAHVVPKRSYNTTLNRFWKIEDPLDLPNPEFENIGDQAVYKYELNLTGVEAQDNQIFGYVPRYSDYKGHVDRFSGAMSGSLKHWHLGSTSAQIAAYSEISPEFIECNPRNDIWVVPGEPDKLLGSFNLNIKANRKLQVNPTPGMTRI